MINKQWSKLFLITLLTLFCLLPSLAQAVTFETVQDLWVDGNAGIGTTNPSYRLDVSGDIRATGTIYGTGLGTTPVTSSGNLQITGTGPHYLSQGNLGIGTMVPTAALSFASNSRINSVAGNLFIGGSGDLILEANGANEVMRIKSGGSVGIGTIAPVNKLSVNGNASIGSNAAAPTNGLILGGNITFNSGATTVPNASGIIFGSATAIWDTGSGITVGRNSSANYGDGVNFTVERGTNMSPTANIQNWVTAGSGSVLASIASTGGAYFAGNVGIGTASPVKKLDVSGAMRAFNLTPAGTSYINVAAVKTLDTYPYDLGGISSYYVDSAWNSATVALLGPALNGYGSPLEYITFKSNGTTQKTSVNGYVGIGTTPSYALDVAGDIRLTGNVIAPAGGSTQGYWVLSGTSLYPTSTSYKVGIGTSTVNNALQLLSGGSSQAIQFNTSDYVGLGQWGTRIFTNDGYNGGTNGVDLAIEVQQAGTWRQAASFGHGFDAWHPSLWTRYSTYLATAGGNAGIGTTNPVAKLEVRSDSPDPIAWGGLSAQYGKLTWTTGRAQIFSTAGNKLSLGANGSDNYLVIDTGGNVGIGTTNPGAKLDVAGTIGMGTGISGGLYWGTPASNRGSITQDASWNWYFSTNGLANAVTLLSSGNVGIGTASPGYKFTIAGGGDIFGVDNNATFLAKNAAGSYERYLWPRWLDNIMYLNYGSSGFHIRDNVSNTVMFMDGFRNVGIGTVSPAGLLHLQAASGSNNMVFSTTGYPSTYRAKILHEESYDGSSSSIPLVIAVENAGTYYNAALFGHGQNATAPSLKTYYTTILAATSGNVGIGTAAPNRLLHVDGGAGDAYLKLRTTASASNYAAGILFDSPASPNDGTTYIRLQGDTSILRYAAAVHDFESGYVGIGTASPGAPLTIQQEGIYSYPNPGSSAKGAINIRMPDSGYSSGLTFGQAGSDNSQAGIYVYQHNSPGTTMHFATTESYATGPQVRMTILNTGYVGIGTVNPAYRLDVLGDIRVSGSIYAPAGGSTQGYWALSGSNLAPTSTSYNVGIGTAGPGGILDVRDATTHQRLLFHSEHTFLDGPATGNVHISANAYWDPSSGWGVFDNAYPEAQVWLGGSTGDINLSTGPAGGGYNPTSRLYISNTGNIGIGTVSPVAKLDVNGNAHVNNWYLYGSDPGNVPALWSNGAAMYLQSVSGDWVTAGYTRGNGLLVGGGGGSGNLNVYGQTYLAGNVGIGTANPGSKLDVQVDVAKIAQFSRTTGTGAGYIMVQSGIPSYSGRAAFGLESSTGGTITNGSSAYATVVGGIDSALQLFAGNNVYQTILTNGYVGIGTVNPAGLLHLQAASGSNNMVFSTTGYPSTYRAKILHEESYDGSSSSIPLVIAVENAGTYYNAALFGHGQNATAPSLKTYYTTILAATSGNVGIGKTNPSYNLDVAGDIRVSGSIYAPAGGSTQGYWQLSGSNLAPTSTSYNVGIGTVSPGEKLTVYGTDNSAPGIMSLESNRQDAGNVEVGRISGKNAGTEVNRISLYRGGGGNSGYLGFWTKYDNAASLTEKVRIDGNGNVGIGTAAPGAKLEVVGSGQFTNSDYSIISNLTGTGGTAIWFKTSAGAKWDLNILPSFGLYSRDMSNYVYTINNTTGLLSYAYGANFATTSGNVGIGTVSPGAGKLQTGAYFTNLGGRLLTSNASGWAADGATPSVVISDTTVSTSKGALIGLALHNDSTTNNTYSPMIAFSRRSNSTSYNSTFAAILGQATGQGVDTNWIAGDLIFANTPVSGYMTESMRINSAGYVGIGSANPQYKLDVAGDIRVTGNIYAPAGGSTQGYWQLNGSNLAPTSTSYNVGIGTADPAGYKLNVNGSFKVANGNLALFGSDIYVSPTNPNTLNGAYSTNGLADMWINYRGYNDGQTQYRNFNIGDGRGANIAWFDGQNHRMSINSGQSADQELVITQTDGNADVRLKTADAAKYTDVYRGTNIGGIYQYGDTDFHIATNGTERLRITSGGLVGIGTTGPAYKLDVNGMGNFASNVKITPASEAWAEGLQFYMPSASTWGGLRWVRNRSNYYGSWYIGYTALDSTNDLVFGANDSGTQRDNILRMTTAGNVGIGTAGPNYKLDVNGTIQANNVFRTPNVAFSESSQRSKDSANNNLETVYGWESSSKSYITLWGFAPNNMYRTTGDHPVPYGIGFANGGESGGIAPIYHPNGGSLGEIMTYGSNDHVTSFTWRRQNWETNTYDASYSNNYDNLLAKIDPDGNFYSAGAVNAAGGLQWNGQSLDNRYLNLSGGGTVTGNVTLTGTLDVHSSANEVSYGHPYIGNFTGWSTTAYPTIGSTGGGSGSLIMLHNPHLPYRTDNAHLGYAGKAAVRMATDENASHWWDMGMYPGELWVVARDSNNPFLSINSSGNVGIGTVSPGSLFQVKGGNNEIASIVGVSSPYLTVGTASNTGGFIRWNTDSGTTQIGNHTVSGGGGIYVASSTGSVGIGTSTINNRMQFLSDGPTTALQFNTSSYVGLQYYATRIYTQDIGNGIPLKIDVQTGGTWRNAVLIGNADNNDNPSLRTYYGTQLAVTSGSVGIGVASPNSKLHVNGPISLYEGTATSGYPILTKQTNVHQYISVESTGSYEAMTRYYNPTANNWYTGIRSGDDTSAYHIYSAAYGGDTLRIGTNGRTGVRSIRADSNNDYADNRGYWVHDPYGYGWGGMAGSFRSLEVSSSGNFSTEPAVFRIHQWGSGAAEFWKPQGTTLYLRETPGGGGGWFTNFNVQTSMNVSGTVTAPTFSGTLSGSAPWDSISGRPGWLGGGSYISDAPSDLNSWMSSGFYQNYAGTNNPVGTWFNFINVRHSNTGNYHGFQLGMSYYDNNLWWRSYQGAGTFQPWVYGISSGNIGSQTVATATNNVLKSGDSMSGSLWLNSGADVTTLNGILTLYSTGNTTTSQIMFKNTSGLGYGNHGAITGSYNTYFVMDTSDRGWIFRNATTATNIASISNTGTIASINGLFSGSVGIGTASPVMDLHVVKPVYSSTLAAARIDNGAQTAYQGTYDTMLVVQPDVPCIRIIETNGGVQANQQELSLAVGDGDAVIRSSSTATNGLSLMVNAAPGAPGYNEASGVLGIKIANNGLVGIGTASPTKTLDVNGTIRASVTVCGGNFFSYVSRSAGIPTDSGVEVAAAMTVLEGAGKTYSCIDCMNGQGAPVGCGYVGDQYCEFQVTC